MSNINQEIEIWKEIESTGGKYSVSNLGNVRNNGFYANVAYGGKRFVKPCLKKAQNHRNGYKIILLTRNKSCVLIHRLVAEAFIPNPDKKEFVNHINGIKHDNRVENLEWVSRKENEDHAVKTGLKSSVGSNNTMAKLNENNVKYILHNYGRISDVDLCKKFNIHRATLHRIVNRKIWKHVKVDLDIKVIDSHMKMVFNTETGIFYDSIVEAQMTTPFLKSHFGAMLSGRSKNRTSFIKL